MPEGNAPAPAVRPLYRTMLIVGLSCISATILAVWLIIPLLRPKHEYTEIYAYSALRAYVQTQAIRRHSANEDKRYAEDMTLLAGTGPLDSAFVKAHGPHGVPMRGYLFLELRSISGQPIDWAKDFALCATPSKYGDFRWRTFIVKSDGIIWSKDLGRSEFVTDFPADPAAAGWTIAE